jgi:transcriptional regulator with XRE-family HTH domain
MKRKNPRYAELNSLKGELRARKLTYRGLAAKASRSVAWVNDILNGNSAPDVDDMMTICDCAGISRDNIERLFIYPNISKRNNIGERKPRSAQKGA